MPELPEVETIRRQLVGDLLGRRVISAWGFDSPKFADAPLATGGRIKALRRRGKYLLADLERDGERLELVVHLGMTGRLAVDPVRSDEVDDPRRLAKHLRARFELDDAMHLGFWDQRRFGRIAVVAAGCHESMPTLAALGPEPFSEEFTPGSLRSALSGRKAIKTALLDQRVVAGVGNIYADEALWLARISPTARRLGSARAEDLHGAVIEVLTAGLDDGGTTLRDYRDATGDPGSHQERLRCYGRAGLPCDRCGGPLSRKVIDGRGTTWCTGCQT
ncbi:MAG: bifunctional DNA-formamidopyrimidine glycosylase/DNA-(apurinic or apyrimidinic site) lyase [Actinomycetia bacterium]|nr:bifunctional DNA-formamidopyrimidine glycosylase/DNA-(apurinic or apyrimidinic site) lyase [Actinomycetes bacterium]